MTKNHGFWMSNSMGLALAGGLTVAKAAALFGAAFLVTGSVALGVGLGLGYAGHAAWKLVRR